MFSLSVNGYFNTEVYEDAMVNVTVVDLVDSDYDLQQINLTYIYDFADGNQTTSNSSSILHSWTNRGTYPITVTVVDDQGALNQKTEEIEIVNQNPEAMITLDTDIPPEEIESSYYGTYDFRRDIIGSAPSDWDVHDWTTVGEESTATIKPNIDHSSNWSPSGTHYSRIDETTPDGTTIYATLDKRIDEFGFTTIDENIKVKQLKFYAYGKRTGEFGEKVYYSTGGGYSNPKYFGFGTSYSWKSITWTVNLTKAQLDNLKLKIESWHESDWEEGRVDIDTLYCEVTYSYDTLVSVVDMGGNYTEVARIHDASDEEQAWMENSFASQDYGTVEFYVRSDDVNETQWSLTFYDNSSMVFSIAMDEYLWKYSIGGAFNNISELSSVSNNTWYHVRVDFLVSGSYLNLSANQFRLTVNNTQSNYYNFSAANGIEKIRFASGTEEQGDIWIDAIGYSFDPSYDINDNKIPSISYPEKSLIVFSAANCTDTESDVSSLRFYWQFGDSTSAYGKYVTHEYMTSGKYFVNLTCKDDNGYIASYVHRILIYNRYPDINITTPYTDITINEGQTVIFNIESSDDYADVNRLEYWWYFDDINFDPSNLSIFEFGGWENAHLYDDDFVGSAYVLVRDPENSYDYDLISVSVKNMDPLASIWDASIVANISFEVYRNSIEKEANFTFNLMGDDDIIFSKLINFDNFSENNFAYSEKELIEMTLSRNWRVFVNSTQELPANSWFRCYVKLQFLNGEELIITSNKLYGGNYGYWQTELNPTFFNNGDYSFMYPVTFHAQVWDPSIDDINLNFTYSAHINVEINCTDTLPINSIFTIDYPLNSANYTVNVFEQDGKKFANITVTQHVLSESYIDNTFPVVLDLNFTIYPIIDLYDILENKLNLTQLTVLDCAIATNVIGGDVVDDDGGQKSLTITFTTESNIEFTNLMPKINTIIPNGTSEGINITIYVEVADFDQVNFLNRYNISNYRSTDIPTLPSDFSIINGTYSGQGDLNLQDNDYVAFLPDHVTFPTQPDDFTLINGTSSFSGDLQSIDGNYTTFCSEEGEPGSPQTQKVYPTGDIYTQWNEGASTPHWSKIDEGTSPDGTKIGEYGTYGSYRIDKQSYGTLDIGGGAVTQLKVYAYGKRDSGSTVYCKTRIYVTGSSSSLTYFSFPTGSWAWKTATWSNLDLSQSQLDSLEIQLNAYNIVHQWAEPGNVYVDSIYVEVTYTVPGDGHLSVTSEFEVDSSKFDSEEDLHLIYSYKTDKSVNITATIWNYNASQYDLVNSSINTTGFYYNYFKLNSSYFNENHAVKVNFVGLNDNDDFNLYLETLKIDIGYINFTSKFQINDLNNSDVLKYLKLFFAYKTVSPNLVNMSVYNFASEEWVLIDSTLNNASYYIGRYSFLSSEYVNESYEIYTRLEALDTELFVDQLKVEYYWAQSSFHGDYLYGNDVPYQPNDFTLENGTSDWIGDLASQNNVYSTFNSTVSNNLNCTVQFHLGEVESVDTINSIDLFYSYKTNISQQIDLSIFNYTSNEWVLIESSINTDFFNGNYSIPATRIEGEGNSSIEYHDFYDLEFNILAKIQGNNESTEFQLFLDLFKVEYNFTSFYFSIDSLKYFDAIEGDYVEFDCTIEYPATFSFKNDVGSSGTSVGFVDWYDPIPSNPPGGGYGYMRVIAEQDGHQSVLQNMDTSVYAGGYGFQVSHVFITEIQYGTVELWVYKKDVGNYDAGCPLVFRDGANNTLFAFNMDVNSDGLVRFTREGETTTWEGLYSDDTWIHIRFDFETRENGNYLNLGQYELNFWFDEVKKLDGVGFYYNSTLENIYWHTLGYANEAEYYFDAMGFSWDEHYEVGQNLNDATYTNEIFNLELTDMEPVKYTLFDEGTIYYSFKTNVSQEMSVDVYNFTSKTWIRVDTTITNNDNYYNSTYTFTARDFINSDYKVNVRFIGMNSSMEEFKILISRLEINYTWDGLVSNFGYDDYIQELTIYFNMTSQYSTVFTGDFAFDVEGTYLVTTIVDDGYSVTKRGGVIEISNPLPIARIGNFPNETFEDQRIDLSADITIFGGNATESNCKVIWSFGDGLYSYENDPIHSWSEAGTYNISLTVIDSYGRNSTDIKELTIIEQAPQIDGPFTFYGVEAQAITLDVQIFDAFTDELSLNYTWYDEDAEIFSNDKKPSIILENGLYDYKLEVKDRHGKISSANISIVVEDAPPMVMMSNYMYYGHPDEGALELTAYGFDTTYDFNELKFSWQISFNNSVDTINDYVGSNRSVIEYGVTETAVYQGIVKVEDPSGKTSVANFAIYSFIDSNGNGFTDEFEYRLNQMGENLTTYSDSDNDGLTDAFELYYNETDWENPDSDGDGLWDGYNNETGVGELSFKTDPCDNDTDNDFLSDYLEVFGWNLTLELRGNTLVTSDPLKNDTDDDNVSDYDEYTSGTNPSHSDTDYDGLNDSIDPYPTKMDADDDGLTDKFEYDIGTELNNSDTDGDGLTDGQEINGWGFKTDPLSADSDHDFLSDTAEMKNYKFKIKKRSDLDPSVSLWFDEYCTKAAGAQIAFTIAFGEANVNYSYGILDVPDINVTIYKGDDNLLIFNGTTNSTRYYSKIIDITETIENRSLDYRGEYIISINNTNAGCLLEQFEIEVVKYLDPHNSDFDGDGIMDGVETGLLVYGTKNINIKDVYGDSVVISFPKKEIAWWPMDDGVGTEVEDLSIYENNGTLMNMEGGDWKAGKIGDHSLELDGVDEYINCGKEFIFDFERTNAYTLSSWVKTSSANGSIISKMNTTNNNRGFDVYCNNTGVIVANIVHDLDSNAITVKGSTAIDDGEWHFIVVTYDGSSNATGVKIYIDDSLDNLTTLKNNLNDTIKNGANFSIGARAGDNYFSGYIDDVRIYNFALSQSDITWLNNSGTGQSTKTLNETNDNIAEQQYYLEIPHIGRVYSGNLTLHIKSKGTPVGQGNLTIKLIKDEINCSIEDYTFSEDIEEFNSSGPFSYEIFFDIEDYVNNGSISEYYGKYTLEIIIHGTNCTDQFELNEFYIETDTFIEAGPSDTEAWSTDPAKWDTDGDGWSDKYEIYDRQEPTNPLSEDTDGDGAWDSYDRDPIRDLIIEISPNYGWHRNLFFWEASPLLEIVVSFSLSGSEYFFCSTMNQASDDQEHIFIWPFWHYYHYRKAYYNGSNGSTELNYYANFDDDIRVQGDSLSLNIELWQMGPKDIFENPLWDTKILDQTETYTMENDMELTLTQTGLFGFQNEVQIEVNTIGLEKANTIAIYKNGTVFNGHYQKQERMNIIQLYVNDDTSLDNTPFVEGPNAIVIPTSLFIETLLNKKIQHEELNQTVLYAEGKSEFISIERNGETEEANDEVDFVFVRFDISGEDAMEVLNMLLTCLVNDTTNETAISYKYASTKLNETDAVLMNLPNTALGFVPWICNYENSAQGRIPHDFGEWLVEKLEEIVKFIIGIFIAIWNAITLIWETIVGFVSEVLMDALPWLGYILWLLVRAVILVITFILFALVLLLTIVGFVLLIPFFYLISLFSNGNTCISLNSLTIQNDNKFFTLEFTTGLYYCEFFDLMIPSINYTCKTNDSIYEFSFHLFSESLSLPSSEFIDKLRSSGDNSTIQSSKLKTSFTEDPDQTVYGTYIAMLIFSIYFALAGSLLAVIKGSLARGVGIIIIILSFSALLTTSILLLRYLSQIGGFTKSFRVGFAFGMMINAVLSSLLLVIHLVSGTFLWFLKLYSLGVWFNKVFSDWDQVFNFESVIKAPNLAIIFFNVSWGFIGFTFADDEWRYLAAPLFLIASVVIVSLLAFLEIEN